MEDRDLTGLGLRSGGGVLIAIHSDLHSQKCDITYSDSEVSPGHLFITTEFLSQKYLLGVTYIRPHSNLTMNHILLQLNALLKNTLTIRPSSWVTMIFPRYIGSMILMVRQQNINELELHTLDLEKSRTSIYVILPILYLILLNRLECTKTILYTIAMVMHLIWCLQTSSHLHVKLY